MNLKYQYLLLTLVLTCIQNLGFAHSPHECFFDINIENKGCTIKAEFPWTLRNALLAYEPGLKNAQTPLDFEQAFEKYISAHLILKDSGGKALVFKGFEALESSGHSHQNEYTLRYAGGNVHQVTNTIMFEMSKKQSNYHSLRVDGAEKTFETYWGKDSFIIDDISVNYTQHYVFSFLAIGIIGLVVYTFWVTSKAKVKENIIEN